MRYKGREKEYYKEYQEKHKLKCKLCDNMITSNTLKGLCKSCSHKGYIPSSHTKKKLSLKLKKWLKNNKHSMLGKKQSLKSINKMRKSYYHTHLEGKNNPFFGKKHKIESIKKQSLSHGGSGIPYEHSIYPEEFYKIRELIRKRDNYECKNCSMTQEEHLIVLGEVLSIHHIDYDKNNCKDDNLISLCRWCNIRANYNREYWKEYYQKKICV
jgi:5-methylcytosine-specific restriction endonuclease McrA